MVRLIFPDACKGESIGCESSCSNACLFQEADSVIPVFPREPDHVYGIRGLHQRWVVAFAGCRWRILMVVATSLLTVGIVGVGWC